MPCSEHATCSSNCSLFAEAIRSRPSLYTTLLHTTYRWWFLHGMVGVVLVVLMVVVLVVVVGGCSALVDITAEASALECERLQSFLKCVTRVLL